MVEQGLQPGGEGDEHAEADEYEPGEDAHLPAGPHLAQGAPRVHRHEARRRPGQPQRDQQRHGGERREHRSDHEQRVDGTAAECRGEDERQQHRLGQPQELRRGRDQRESDDHGPAVPTVLVLGSRSGGAVHRRQLDDRER